MLYALCPLASNKAMFIEVIFMISVFSNSGEAKKELIKKAMRHWEQNTCLVFENRTTQKGYIEFIQSPLK